MINQKNFQLRLHSPAFLGDAHQSGVWRTPPIKALLREWWRVAEAPKFDHLYPKLRDTELRDTEGLLFGNAWLEADAEKNSRFCKSKVRIALEHWNDGEMRKLEHLEKIEHPEIIKEIEPLNYLGYGPIDKGILKNGAALQVNESNTLSLAWPEKETRSITHALQLIDWFGTFGGRSRNGWGSLSLELQPLTADHTQLTAVLRELKECLQLDWPHAIGRDNRGPLVWESAEAFDDWKSAMRFLAITKIGFRTSLKFEGGEPHSLPQERHILAYPVTHHKVGSWGNGTRLANQARFKLVPTGNNKLKARIYHTPHKSPTPISNIDELAVWQKIHRWLDNPKNKLLRLGA